MPTNVDSILEFALDHCRSDPTYRHPLDRRTDKRVQVLAPATIQPVTNSLFALGEAADVITRDISRSGITLIVDTNPQEEFQLIHVTLPDDQHAVLLGKVYWSDKLGPYRVVGHGIMRWLHDRPKGWPLIYRRNQLIRSRRSGGDWR